jgi:hypothetical protein
MSQSDYNKLSVSEKKQEDWMNAKWRPMMGWTYMATCIFDFILGPILFNILQYLNPGQAVGMWTPLTLQGGGLYHIAMGAIIGISAYGRTKEKLEGANNGGLPLAPPVQVQQPVMMGPGQGVPQSNFAAPPMQPVQTTVTQTFAPPPPPPMASAAPAVKMVNGKPAPTQPDFPEI